MRIAQSVIHAPGFRSLAEGEEVEFVVEEQGNGKVRAADVTGPNGDFVKVCHSAVLYRCCISDSYELCFSAPVG
jgi:hypothetical protein